MFRDRVQLSNKSTWTKDKVNAGMPYHTLYNFLWIIFVKGLSFKNCRQILWFYLGLYFGSTLKLFSLQHSNTVQFKILS